MSNIIPAIYDDMKEYEQLCEDYDEEVQSTLDVYGNWIPACYGEHADQLKKRSREERYQNRN